MTSEYLLDVYVRIREAFPEIAEHLDALGRATDAAGPLDERTRRLIKLGIGIGATAFECAQGPPGRCLRGRSTPGRRTCGEHLRLPGRCGGLLLGARGSRCAVGGHGARPRDRQRRHRVPRPTVVLPA